MKPDCPEDACLICSERWEGMGREFHFRTVRVIEDDEKSLKRLKEHQPSENDTLPHRSVRQVIG